VDLSEQHRCGGGRRLVLFDHCQLGYRHQWLLSRLQRPCRDRVYALIESRNIYSLLLFGASPPSK